MPPEPNNEPRLLTPEEAQKAYDEAVPVPLSEERIQEIVDYATGKAADVEHARTRDVGFGAMLMDLVKERGAIVCSADCSEMELAFARREGRFYVDERGFGYVLRMQQWRANAEAALHDVAESHRREHHDEEPQENRDAT
jgi:hypothetical protein